MSTSFVTKARKNALSSKCYVLDQRNLSDCWPWQAKLARRSSMTESDDGKTQHCPDEAHVVSLGWRGPHRHGGLYKSTPSGGSHPMKAGVLRIWISSKRHI